MLREGCQRKLSRSPGKRPSETSATYFAAAARICGSELGVLPDEFGMKALEHSQQVVDDQDLSVAVRAGADADRRDRQLGGDLGGQLAGDALEDDAERAGVGDRVGVGEELVGRALNLVSPHPPDGLRPQPDVPHRGDLGVDQGLDRRRHLAAAFELDGLAIGLFEDPAGRPKRLPRRDLIAEERQVGDDQGVMRRPGDHLGVIDHLFERDPQRRFPALDHGPQRVADQDAIDAGLVEQAGGRVVIGGQDGDPPVLLTSTSRSRER